MFMGMGAVNAWRKLTPAPGAPHWPLGYDFRLVRRPAASAGRALLPWQWPQ